MATKKPTNAKIVGERIYLRLLVARDRDEFIALNRSSKRLHRGLVSPPTVVEDFRKLITRSRRNDVVCFVICRVDDGKILGLISLSQIFRGGFQNAYLGYYIGSEFAGRGYTSDAVDLILKYAFDDLRLHRVEANIQPTNQLSIAIVKRAGFVLEGLSRRYLKICGRWRDHERWAIIAEDWKAKRRSRAAK